MTAKEFNSLKAYSYASRYQPRTSVTSRRTSKSKSNATGQILKDSRIVSQRVRFLSWKT